MAAETPSAVTSLARPPTRSRSSSHWRPSATPPVTGWASRDQQAHLAAGYRQFGVLVTTSHLDAQAYTEIREDGHPVVVLAGADVIGVLKSKGFTSVEAVNDLLKTNYAAS
jgi:hypothetical protein